MRTVTNKAMYRELIPGETSLYLQPDWMDVFAKDWSAQIGLSAKNQPVWLWPYQEKSRYGIKKYGRLPFCPDNGPVFLEVGLEKDFDPNINRWFSVCAIDDRSRHLDSQSMITAGWNQEDRTFQYIDLVQYPRDFQSVSRSKRKRMKKNSHLEFCRIEELDDVADTLLFYFHSVGYLHFKLDDLKKWQEALDASFDHYLFGIRDSRGQILAVQWLVGYGDILYGWIAVRHPRDRETDARELLLWYIIQWARRHYKTYDLGGSSMAGVRRFNLEMGADEIQYHRFQRYRPDGIRTARKIFKL